MNKTVEDALRMGLDDDEVRLYLGMDPDEELPVPESKRELLRKTPMVNAKKAISEALERGNTNVAKWYYEGTSDNFKKKRKTSVEINTDNISQKVLEMKKMIGQ